MNPEAITNIVKGTLSNSNLFDSVKVIKEAKTISSSDGLIIELHNGSKFEVAIRQTVFPRNK